MAKLEKELGTVLIDRHSMEPTAEGSAVVERARRIRTELQAIEDDIVSMRHEVAGEVRIGCIGTTGRWMATPLLGELSARHPALRYCHRRGPTGWDARQQRCRVRTEF